MANKKKYFTEGEIRAAKNKASREAYAKNKSKPMSPKRRLQKKNAAIRYYQRNREEILVRNRAKWAANPDAKAQSCRQGKKWREANPERYEEYHKNYRATNAEAIRAASREYRENNRQACIEKCRLYTEKNRESIRAKERETYHLNPEKSRAKGRAWYKKNPARANEYVMRRRAVIKANPVSSRDEIVAIYAEAARLQLENGVSYEVDHIIPITSGGWHDHRNLQPMPEKMNGRAGKWNNPFWLAPSPAYKDWRDVPRELWPVKMAPKYLELIEKNRGKSIRWDTAA